MKNLKVAWWSLCGTYPPSVSEPRSGGYSGGVSPVRALAVVAVVGWAFTASAAYVPVENDMKVDDLFVETGSAKFLLNDHVLSVTSMEHRNGLGWRGETNKKKAKAYVDSICDKGTEGRGEIAWPRLGLMLFVR